MTHHNMRSALFTAVDLSERQDANTDSHETLAAREKELHIRELQLRTKEHQLREQAKALDQSNALKANWYVMR